MAWATTDDAHAAWAESAHVDPDRLADLLDLSTSVLTAYARPSDLDDAGDPVPAAVVRLREACVQWAKDAWAVGVSDTGDVIGFDTYALRRRPLSDHVRTLLRPPGPAVVG